MIDEEKKKRLAEEKAKTRKRMHVAVDEENYEYIPATKKTADYADNDKEQRVGIYVRVSTDDVRQTTSFELQKKYYEDFVIHHPKWTLVKIYADEGKSGTETTHRVQFKQMIEDAKNGKIDLIVTKSVSRFARNTMVTIGMVRELAALQPPVGVFFESECIFSLNEETSMPLTFLATIAEEESHIRSRSMESSLRMRLDNGIPLTPKLLGYKHDEEGNLIINEEEAPTVKLIFYMYLYGYSTQQIANALLALERKSYLGNTNKWTPGIVVQILRNERHCGDVLTRKTYTPSFLDHKSKRNTGFKPQSHYRNHHEAIVSRDDFIAVQKMLESARYRNKSFLPELKVIDSGVLRGFVTIYPRWAAFKPADYYKAALSAYEIDENDGCPVIETEVVEPQEGDFDLRGFEVARSEFFDERNQPTLSFNNRQLLLSKVCTQKFGARNYVELLINPIEKKFAVRVSTKDHRQAVVCSKLSDKVYRPKEIAAAAFFATVYEIFNWNIDHKYKIIGTLYEQNNEVVYIFNAEDSEAYLKSYLVPIHTNIEGGESTVKPLTQSGKRIRAIPQHWTESFGTEYYAHERTLQELAVQNETDWKLRIEGQLCESANHLHVTDYNVLRDYIMKELQGIDIGGIDERND